MRSTTLAPEFYLCTEVHQRSTGQKVTCWGDLELLPVLDSFCGTLGVTVAEEVLSFRSEEGLIDVTPIWTSNSDSRLVPGGLAAEQLNSMLKRLARLRRLTGASATQHLARVMTAADNAENFFPINTDALEAAMREVNLTPKQLALLAGVPLNAVQRALKYAYAHESFIPRLSDALGIGHPNELLPLEKEEGTGIRIEDGAVFLRALKQTHMWRRIVGESLQGAEAEEVHRIAEALQDYVEMLQFRTGPFSEHVKGFDALEQPVDESSLAHDIQGLLDELNEIGVAVVVSENIRYAHGAGRLQEIDGMPLHHGTLFFEKISALKSPRPQSVTAA